MHVILSSVTAQPLFFPMNLLSTDYRVNDIHESEIH